MELTAAQIDARLRDLTEEQNRLLREEGLRDYDPYHKQRLFHKAVQPIRAFVAANKAGKSWAGTADMLWTVGKTHPWRPNLIGPVWGRDCCVDFPTLRQTLLPIYQKMAPRYPCELPGLTFEGKKRLWPGLRKHQWSTAYSKEEKTLYLGDNSSIEFKSYDQDQESFGGPVRHVIRMDEEPPEFVFGENMARQMTTAVNLIFTVTMLGYSQWLYDLLIQRSQTHPEDVFMVMADATDNPFVNLSVLKIMDEHILDEAEREARLHGRPTYLSGRILKNYGDHNLIDYKPPPRNWPIIIGIDPHAEKPTEVTWTALDPSENIPYVYREKTYANMDVEQISNDIKLTSQGENIERIIADPSTKQSASIRGEEAGRPLCEMFEDHLPELELGNNHNKDEYRDLLNKLCKNRTGKGPLFFVMRSCPKTHSQLLGYSWAPPPRSREDRKKPRVLKRNEDKCDCIIHTLQAIDFDMTDEYVGPKTSIYGNPEKTGFQFGATHIGRA